MWDSESHRYRLIVGKAGKLDHSKGFVPLVFAWLPIGCKSTARKAEFGLGGY
jgi:hypothetical protein